MTKQEERAANRQKAEELQKSRSQQQVPVSPDTDISFPLTSPAAKQQAERLEQEKAGAFAKPYPTGSNLATPATAATEPLAQTPEEFAASGGQKITDAPGSVPTSGATEDTADANVDAKVETGKTGEETGQPTTDNQ